MVNKKTTFILTITTSIVLFILTFMYFGNLFESIVPNLENIRYNAVNVSSPFKIGLYFSIVVGLVPILLFNTWKLASITNTKNRILSGLLTVVLLILSIVIRQQIIKSTFNNLPNLKTDIGEKKYIFFPIDNLHFEYYLLGGLILSCILSFLLFKNKVMIN